MKLISFIVSQRERLGGKTLYVTCNNLCFKVTRDDVIEEDLLKTSQEEADTRVIFHSLHAAPNVSSIIIVAEDTDIILLCLAFQKRMNCSMYVKCGTSTRTR